MIFLFNTLAIHRFKTFDYSHSRDFNRNLIEDVGRQTLDREKCPFETKAVSNTRRSA